MPVPGRIDSAQYGREQDDFAVSFIQEIIVAVPQHDRRIKDECAHPFLDKLMCESQGIQFGDRNELLIVNPGRGSLYAVFLPGRWTGEKCKNDAR